VTNQIFEIAHRRRLYREMRAMVDANPALQVPSAFYDWQRSLYVVDMTIAIRRLVDWDDRSISFVQLMEDIAKHPDVLSRRGFVHGYPAFMKEAGHEDFERFAKPGAQSIDPRVIRRHRKA
jgi:hypothetical protein